MLNKQDLAKGIKVTYVPKHTKHDVYHPDREVGIISSWNDKYVFVQYSKGPTKATELEDLQLGDETFICEDSRNSRLDSLFGRCSSVCTNCKRN